MKACLGVAWKAQHWDRQHTYSLSRGVDSSHNLPQARLAPVNHVVFFTFYQNGENLLEILMLSLRVVDSLHSSHVSP